MSWFVSPILSGAAAALIFFTVRFLVLRRKNAYQLSFWTLPPFVCLTVWINVYFILTKVNTPPFRSIIRRRGFGVAGVYFFTSCSRSPDNGRLTVVFSWSSCLRWGRRGLREVSSCRVPAR